MRDPVGSHRNSFLSVDPSISHPQAPILGRVGSRPRQVLFLGVLIRCIRKRLCSWQYYHVRPLV